MKNSSDTFGNRTRDLPACSAMPQPTAPSRFAIHFYSSHILSPDRPVRKEEWNLPFDVVSTQECVNESLVGKLWFIRLCSYVFPLTWYLKVFFTPMPPHVRHGLRGLPPGCGRSVTDFWGWDTHEVQLRCPNEVDGDIWIWSTRRDLKTKFY
jgi:hypothetical protein